jgi:hypothetical protein
MELMYIARKTAGIPNLAGWTRRKRCCYHPCCPTSRIIKLPPGVERNFEIGMGRLVRQGK